MQSLSKDTVLPLVYYLQPLLDPSVDPEVCIIIYVKRLTLNTTPRGLMVAGQK